MIKKALSFKLSAISLLLLCNISYAQSISSNELINNAKQYDGEKIVYRGEIIGDIMVRGEYAWININDGNSAIGIWAGKDLVKDIFYAGNYKTRGDIVEVKGVFNRSCREHGGDLDIHAERLTKLEEGYQIRESLDPQKLRLAIILGIVFFLALILNYIKKK